MAGVPSGASTGTREAVELRDGDPKRFKGAGVTKAVANVNGEINQLLSGRSWKSLEELDQRRHRTRWHRKQEPSGRQCDGRCVNGGGASHGFCGRQAPLPLAGRRRGLAAPTGAQFQRRKRRRPRAERPRVPGVHALPSRCAELRRGIAAGSEVYLALRLLLHAKGHSTGLGDEGGFAPNLGTPEEVLDLLMEAITAAGYTAGPEGIGIALDPASSEMREPDGTYRYSPGTRLTTDEMISKYEALQGTYPIWSIEDGLGEDDWDGWERLTAQLGDRVQLVGDDLFVTNPSIIREGIAKKVANSALIKLNQIGTVSETLQAIAVCRDAGYTQFVSHRSGETDDTFIADLAVASGCGQIKTGAPARGERVAKYNRLARIELEVPALPYGLADRR